MCFQSTYLIEILIIQVTPVLCPYSKMGTPFNNILRAFEKIDDAQLITKRFEDSNEFNLTAQLKRYNQNQQKINASWKIMVESKNKILGKSYTSD